MLTRCAVDGGRSSAVDMFFWCPYGCFIFTNNGSGISTCALCPAGRYSDVIAAAACRNCTTGTFNPIEGASQPTLKSQQRARQQLQSLHAQRCTPRHCFSTKSYGAAAAAAVLLCLCCAVGIAAAQQTPCPSGWSTAVLSEARQYLAAASLPNQGLAIFAGGVGSFVTCC